MKKAIFLALIVLFLSACSEETTGNYVDIRERSDYFDDDNADPLTDDHLPDGEITKNKNGATEGTPAKIGDTVIYKTYSGEELGLTIKDIVRGEDAYKKVKEKYEVIEKPSKGKEYVILDIEFSSYNSMSKPYPVYYTAVEIWSEENKYEVELPMTDDIKDDLQTGENTIVSLAYSINKDEKEIYAVNTLEGVPIWIEL